MPSRKCIVCEKPHYARGWCRKHYVAWRKHGDPLATKQIQHHGLSLEERLWSHVDKSGGPAACWLWTGKGRTKYGHALMWNGKRREGAHRIAWRIANGPIPESKQINHHCDDGSCCNPLHLYAGTQAENMRDVADRARGTMHMAKLTKDQVTEVHALAQKGIKPAALAARFDVTTMTIVRILRGETWQSITGRTESHYPIARRPTRGMTLEERLWFYVDRTQGSDACWPWIGESRGPGGKGVLWNSAVQRNEYAHRLAWRFTHGEILEELWVVHTCPTVDCCNPKHLVLKAPQEASKPRKWAPRRGEGHGNSALTEEQVQIIRRLKSEGLKQTLIAERFGVSRQTVGLILTGKTWRHVT